MSFDTVQDEENASVKQTQGPVNPWWRFPKGADGKVDTEGPSIRFRFLLELFEMRISRNHWDKDIKKAVACNRTFKKGKPDEKGNDTWWPEGECLYCDRQKAINAEFKARQEANQLKKGEKYPDGSNRMKATLVAPVAVLVDKIDEKTKKPVLDDNGDVVQEQKFYLMPLNVLDRYYKTAKGFWKWLNNWSKNKKTVKGVWFEFGPNNFLTNDSTVTKEDNASEIVGLEDVTAQMDKAAPFPYADAMELREKLNKADEGVQEYEQAAEEVLREKATEQAETEKPKAAPKSKGKAKAEPAPETGDYQDDEIPF